jgi:hypothetical protein
VKARAEDSGLLFCTPHDTTSECSVPPRPAPPRPTTGSSHLKTRPSAATDLRPTAERDLSASPCTDGITTRSPTHYVTGPSDVSTTPVYVWVPEVCVIKTSRTISCLRTYSHHRLLNIFRYNVTFSNHRRVCKQVCAVPAVHQLSFTK